MAASKQLLWKRKGEEGSSKGGKGKEVENKGKGTVPKFQTCGKRMLQKQESLFYVPPARTYQLAMPKQRSEASRGGQEEESSKRPGIYAECRGG